MHHGLCRRDLDQSRTSKPNQWKSQLDSLIMLVDCKHFATGSCRLLTSELGKVVLVSFKKIGFMDFCFDFYREIRLGLGSKFHQPRVLWKSKYAFVFKIQLFYRIRYFTYDATLLPKLFTTK